VKVHALEFISYFGYVGRFGINMPRGSRAPSPWPSPSKRERERVRSTTGVLQTAQTTDRWVRTRSMTLAFNRTHPWRSDDSCLNFIQLLNCSDDT